MSSIGTQWIVRAALMLAIAAWSLLAVAAEASQWEQDLSAGVAHRKQGNLGLSIQLLTQSARAATTNGERSQSAGELGASLLQARRLNDAETALREAYSFFSGAERARYAIDLGNLALIRKRQNEAQQYYREALQLSGDDAGIRIIARLNLARLSPANARLEELAALAGDIGRIEDAKSRARFFLNVGTQAQALGSGAVALAYRSLDQARQLSADGTDSRLRIETLDALAQLYESQDRKQEALLLTQQAMRHARAATDGAVGDLLINLEWRQGRLYHALGNSDWSLAAYQRAVEQIEMLRQDIPIEYEDGGSSFRRTLEPVYLGLVEKLLEASDREPARRTAYLRRVRDAIELVKQAELQDYLGDRCAVDAVKGGTATVIPAGTAVLYPIVLADRIELLLETGSDMARFSSRVADSLVRRTAVSLANDLRDGTATYMSRSRQLYDWLLRPLEQYMAEGQITTLVIVPDGSLRLVAMAALHDGSRFAIEKFAISTATGLSMTNTSSPATHGTGFLVAGISEPGPVVDKLSQLNLVQLLGPAPAQRDDTGGLAQKRTMRSFAPLRAVELTSTRTDDAAGRARALREALTLPGVKAEVEAISRISRSTSMLNEPFTVDRFRRAAESGAYRVVHVASHGVFGGSAESSYILAFDDVLTLDGLESLLKSDQFRKNPIELLSLSACETAEGDERSPLGISGAAIKARARSVLGTLWGVEDNSARIVMESFYRGLLSDRLSKAQALRQSQIELIRSSEFAHPFFWAPFVLVGNWL